MVPIDNIFERSQNERNMNGNKRKSKEQKHLTTRSNHLEFIDKSVHQRKDDHEMRDTSTEHDCTNNAVSLFTTWLFVTIFCKSWALFQK